jgi:hypothetical protein
LLIGHVERLYWLSIFAQLDAGEQRGVGHEGSLYGIK